MQKIESSEERVIGTSQASLAPTTATLHLMMGVLPLEERGEKSRRERKICRFWINWIIKRAKGF
jgi:hypothetical protein